MVLFRGATCFVAPSSPILQGAYQPRKYDKTSHLYCHFVKNCLKMKKHAAKHSEKEKNQYLCEKNRTQKTTLKVKTI